MNDTLSGERQSSLMMLPSMVDELPNGYATPAFAIACIAMMDACF